MPGYIVSTVFSLIHKHWTTNAFMSVTDKRDYRVSFILVVMTRVAPGEVENNYTIIEPWIMDRLSGIVSRTIRALWW
jgi:hypothetical protein